MRSTLLVLVYHDDDWYMYSLVLPMWYMVVVHCQYCCFLFPSRTRRPIPLLLHPVVRLGVAVLLVLVVVRSTSRVVVVVVLVVRLAAPPTSGVVVVGVLLVVKYRSIKNH